MRLQELRKEQEKRRNELEKKINEKSQITYNIKNALGDYMNQKKELKLLKKQE